MKSKSRLCKNILEKKGVFLNNYGLPKIVEKDLWFLKELIEKNKIKPVLDKVYSIDDVVEAHGYVDKGHKKGNVILSVSSEQ
jgi:NADPH:quinone reductase-like Zn-dependent oxidoreductase